MDVGVFILSLMVVFVVIIIMKGLHIVQQSQVRIVERLGRYHKTLNSGVNIIIPIVDQTRGIKWRYLAKDPSGRTIYHDKYVSTIDLRETVYDFPRQNVITADNVTIEINAILYFQVTDAVKAIYEVENLPDAIEKLTQTTLRNVIGELDLDQTLTSRDTINSKLRSILDEATDKWGVKVNRVELQDINPPSDIRDAMEKQMRAERTRRAQILEAEGEKQAAILNAEGVREAEIAQAEGGRQALILEAEGIADGRVKVAEAEARSIKRVVDSVGNSSDAVNYLVAIKYIDTLKEIANSPQKTVFLPYEASAVLGALGGVKELLGHMGDDNGGSGDSGPKPSGTPPKQTSARPVSVQGPTFE